MKNTCKFVYLPCKNTGTSDYGHLSFARLVQSIRITGILYKIFNKEYVGSRDLAKLSLILHFNFFEVIAEEMKKELAKNKEY